MVYDAYTTTLFDCFLGIGSAVLFLFDIVHRYCWYRFSLATASAPAAARLVFWHVRCVRLVTTYSCRAWCLVCVHRLCGCVNLCLHDTSMRTENEVSCPSWGNADVRQSLPLVFETTLIHITCQRKKRPFVGLKPMPTRGETPHWS